jgi:sugar lactone lactonase YvrE
VTSLEDFRELVDDVNHPEGVAWDPSAGCLYAGGETGELYRVDPAGKAELLGSTGGWMLGVAVDGDGRVYACDHGRGRIARFDPSTGTFEDYGRGREEPFDTPNVAVFDAAGNLYLTCSGEGGRPEIARVDPSGDITTWTTDVPGYPNGAVVTPDGSALLVVEAKAERVVRIEIRSDGAAGRIDTFVQLPRTDADGLALDAEGYLWVTLYRPDGLVRVAPDGTIVERVDDLLAGTLNAPTNIAFYGDDLERAAVATVGSRHILDVDLGVAGQRLFYPKGLP